MPEQRTSSTERTRSGPGGRLPAGGSETGTGWAAQHPCQQSVSGVFCVDGARARRRGDRRLSRLIGPLGARLWGASPPIVSPPILARCCWRNSSHRLAKFFGTTPDLWMNLQLRWDLYHAQEAEARDLERIKRVRVS